MIAVLDAQPLQVPVDSKEQLRSCSCYYFTSTTSNYLVAKCASV